MPERTILTAVGPIEIAQPRVNDRRVDANGNRKQYRSKILPPYLRRTSDIEELIPWLYLKGISTGDFTNALTSLVGADAKGLSPSTIVRLKEDWLIEYRNWANRSLKDKNYLYVWADGVYFNVRLEGERCCVLVLIGVTEDGQKELLAVEDGVRESEISWTQILVDLKKRGLTKGPQLVIGDGALGFWKAAEKIYPNARHQRCWVHKTANILNRLPSSLQDKGKQMLHEIWMAEGRNEATNALEKFSDTFEKKYPKAVECLVDDKDELLAFYSFPAEHWTSIRTTNPIESMFATVRLRTNKTKGCGSVEATMMMVFKLAQSAEKGWRRLRGYKLLEDVAAGVKFEDGIRKAA
jgi:transposase-like protein